MMPIAKGIQFHYQRNWSEILTYEKNVGEKERGREATTFIRRLQSRTFMDMKYARMHNENDKIIQSNTHMHQIQLHTARHAMAMQMTHTSTCDSAKDSHFV